MRRPLTVYEPATISDIEGVAEAIDDYRGEHGFADVDDSAWDDAILLVPKGTSIEAHPDRIEATHVRVILPNGSNYRLAIEHDGDLRGDSWHMTTQYVVESAEVVR